MIKKIILVFASILWLIPFGIMALIAFSSKNTNSFTELLTGNSFTMDNIVNAWQEAQFSKFYSSFQIRQRICQI